MKVMVVRRKRSRGVAGGKSMVSTESMGDLTMMLLGCLCSK